MNTNPEMADEGEVGTNPQAGRRRMVVYTAITGGYDALRAPPAHWLGVVDFVAFLERPQTVPGWEVRPIHREFEDPCRNAKIHKILPHVYFSDHEFSLWVDGNVAITHPGTPWELVDEYLKELDLAVFRHRHRNCAYVEALAISDGGMDAAATVDRQMARYWDEGYPVNNGLAECSVLLRRHSAATRQFCEAWHGEIKAHSRRDQLSFNYVATKLGFGIQHFNGSMYYVGECGGNSHFAWAGRHAHGRHKVAGAARRKNRGIMVSSPPGPVTGLGMVFLYYDNAEMLRKQLTCWNMYADTLDKPPTVILVDDGSPHSSAADVVREHGCEIPIRVLRIKEDIAWNFTGARNLGCMQAEGWIYVSDIDTLLFPEDAKVLFESAVLDKSNFYVPAQRVWLPDMTKTTVGNVNLLFHKEKYLELGGYDEDYAGSYGKGDTDFLWRMRQIARETLNKEVVLRVVPPTVVCDARTTGMVRDKTHNNGVFSKKRTAGFPRPVNPLRFTWERVL